MRHLKQLQSILSNFNCCLYGTVTIVIIFVIAWMCCPQRTREGGLIYTQYWLSMTNCVKTGSESDKFRIDLIQQQYLKDFNLWIAEWGIPGEDVSLKAATTGCLRLQVIGSSHQGEESDYQIGCQGFRQTIWISEASSSSRCKLRHNQKTKTGG